LVARDLIEMTTSKGFGGSPQMVSRIGLKGAKGHAINRSEPLAEGEAQEATTARVAAGATFVAYRPSSFEQLWLDHVREWQHTACSHVGRRNASQWMRSVQRLASSKGEEIHYSDTPTPPPAVTNSPLSSFTYELTRSDRPARFAHVLIEPTAGIVKDPRKCWDPHGYGQSKEYLVPLTGTAAATAGLWAQAASGNRRAGRKILFDAGATLPSGGDSSKTSWTGTSFIFKMYEQRGIVFDQIYAWEPSLRGKVDVEQAKAKMDPKIARGLHFFLRGCSAAVGHPDNPLTLIASICRPDDFCVFKLDVDTTHIEMSLAAQLLWGDAELRSLVDEFYFEHHFVRDRGARDNMESWYAMATYARRSGLRMHYWP